MYVPYIRMYISQEMICHWKLADLLHVYTLIYPSPSLPPFLPLPLPLSLSPSPCLQIVPGLPKTRSGKIMRRILRKIAADRHEELGDVSTLADPSVVEKIVQKHMQSSNQ